jgi:hypothetical protein
MRSRVLINEPPILLLPSLAVEIGVNEAMVLQQIHYWLMNERNKNRFDGHVWVRNTYDQWGRQFPFWGEKTLRRTFTSLEEMQLIHSHLSYEEYRKTKFYTIQYNNVEKLGLESHSDMNVTTPTVSDVSGSASGQNDRIDKVKLGKNRISGPPSGQIDQTQLVKMTRSYTEAETTFRDNNILPPPNPPQLQVPEDEDDLDQIDFEKSGDASKPSLESKGQTHLPVWAGGTGQNDQIGRSSGLDVNVDGPGFKQLLHSLASGQNDQIEAPKMADAPDHSGGNSAIPSQLKPSEDEEEDLPQKMIKVWNHLVQGKIKDAPRKELVLTDARRQALVALFKGMLDGDFAEWERLCSQISATKFLLGNNESGFKVSLEWALNTPNALKVLEGRIYDKPQDKAPMAKELAEDDFQAELLEHFTSSGYPNEWLKVYQILCQHKGQSFFRSWLKACVPLPVRLSHALLLAPTRFQRDYMNTNLLDDIRAAARSCWPDLEELTIEVKA